MRITELHLEQFKKEGVDHDIKHAKTRWKELLADLRFLGNCYSDDTELLTKKGWKLFKDVTKEDEIATLNLKTEEIEYQKPLELYSFPYEGELLTLEGKKVSIHCTPEQNILRQVRISYSNGTRKTYWKLTKAKDLPPKDTIILKRDGKWNGNQPDFFILPSYKRGLNQFKQIYVPEKKVPFLSWVKFLAWYLAEGTSKLHNEYGCNGYTVTISQKKDKNKIKEISSIIRELGFKPHRTKEGIDIYDKGLALYLKRFGTSKNKFIPQYIKDSNSQTIREFLKVYVKADGYSRRRESLITTSSKQLADDLQELTLKAGCPANLRKDKNGLYWLELSTRPYASVRKCNRGTRFYSGLVYDVKVPNGIIMIRREGKIVWSGNSGYPKLVRGEKWSNWDMDSLLSYFAAIVDALRSVYFPLIPPSKDDPRYNTSYWKVEELSEWDKKRKDIIKTSLEETKRKIDGLYLTYPHGELFWTKEKTLLVKTRKFDLSKPHYLIDDGLCYGIISFKEPKRITKEQFFTEDLKKKHHILDTEAWQWWRMSRDNAVEPELWAYEVEKFEPFEIPERVKIPKGIQVIIDADNIEFVGKDEEQPARIDWPTTATKEAKTDYIKFYGTKGYIEEENDEHKYHTCILLSLNDTNILLDYGERHPEEIKERIDIILNSHCHIDHLCPEISSFVCPIYISKQTLNRVDFSLPEDIRIYEARKAFSISNIKIITYPVYHSIRAPMHIFKIETDGLAIGVMTDFLGFEEVEDEEFFYPNLDIVIIDGSSITKDLRRWKEDHNLIFGHKSVIHQIERIRDKCKKNPIVILTHIGREGIEWGDLQILQYLHERFAGMHIYIAKDGSVFDLKTRRFTEAFKGEQICKDIVANLPSFTWIPEFTSITGSTLFTKDHAPRDLDVICKAEEINGKWYIPVDTSLLLKLQRAYQYATKKVLGKAIKPEFPPPALIGANWSSIPAYDLKLVPRKNPEIRRF